MASMMYIHTYIHIYASSLPLRGLKLQTPVWVICLGVTISYFIIAHKGYLLHFNLTGRNVCRLTKNCKGNRSDV